MEQFKRLSLLIGEDKFNTLMNKKILILGIGGVGGYALEALVRSGIKKIIIVDYDNIDITNLNRQVITLHSNVGLLKVDVALKRAKDINPNCEIVTIKEKINKDNVHLLTDYNPDYIIDACDTLIVKKKLIKLCLSQKIKFISCMGTGNKMDPLKLTITDIRKTSYDPLAREIRKMVVKERIKDKIWVVSSNEKPIDTSGQIIASNSYVPAIAGLLCASFVINDIVK